MFRCFGVSVFRFGVSVFRSGVSWFSNARILLAFAIFAFNQASTFDWS